MNKATIEHYNQFITGIEDMSGNGRRFWYHIGENFLIEVCRCDHDLSKQNDLMNIWKKHGYIEKPLATHVSIRTYFTDAQGNCWGYYNVTEKNGKVNFDCLLEWSEDNISELVAECIRMREMDIT